MTYVCSWPRDLCSFFAPTLTATQLCLNFATATSMASLDSQADPQRLLPLYRIDPPQTMTAITSFQINGGDGRYTYTFNIDARHSADTVAFLDIKMAHLPGLYADWERSMSITVTVGRSANPIATVDSLSIQDIHESPMGSDMQVRVYHQSNASVISINVDLDTQSNSNN